MKNIKNGKQIKQREKIMDETIKNLISKAIDAKNYAYAPYSNYKVGAALLADNDEVYTGCNIENSAYSPTNCAERTAFFKAVSEGNRKFKAIAITGGENNKEGSFCSPCGVCMQVMTEFCDIETFKIMLANSENDYVIYTLKQLMPLAFKL